MGGPRAAERQAQARDLARATAEVTEGGLPATARALPGAGPAAPLGATESRARQLASRIAAKACGRRPAQKQLNPCPLFLGNSTVMAGAGEERKMPGRAPRASR